MSSVDEGVVITGTDLRARRGDHFRQEDWVDFARQQDDPEQRKYLETHLDTGCARCAHNLRFWKAVIRITADEPSYGPPANAVRQLKGHFALHRPEKLLDRALRAAVLVFDSFRQPVAAVRGVGPSARQLLYRAGRFLIRLQLERKGDPERVSIVGQLLDEQQPEKALRDIAVLVSKGGRALDRTLTNYLGEFTLEPNAAGTLRLSVGVPEIGTFTVQQPRTEGDADERASGLSDRSR
jgi:hypothetical protein